MRSQEDRQSLTFGLEVLPLRIGAREVPPQQPFFPIQLHGEMVCFEPGFSVRDQRGKTNAADCVIKDILSLFAKILRYVHDRRSWKGRDLMRLEGQSEGVIRTRMPRLVFLFGLLLLCGCSQRHWHMTNITGAMPRLAFHLSDANLPVTAENFRGKVIALYFGYTHCPDVCPTTLANLTDVLHRVHSANVEVLFVTVDPDRDSAQVLANYTSAFSPQIVGLRGSANQLADLARRYRVAYIVSKGPPYEVMHSNAVFFFDPHGRARLVTTNTNDTASIADDVRQLLAS